MKAYHSVYFLYMSDLPFRLPEKFLTQYFPNGMRMTRVMERTVGSSSRNSFAMEFPSVREVRPQGLVQRTGHRSKQGFWDKGICVSLTRIRTPASPGTEEVLKLSGHRKIIIKPALFIK